MILLKISEAYSSISEYERAYQVIRGAYTGYFYREAEVAGILIANNKTEISVKFMDELFKSYPNLNLIKNTYYSFWSRALYADVRA